jgi:hypothetical protein
MYTVDPWDAAEGINIMLWQKPHILESESQQDEAAMWQRVLKEQKDRRSF